MVRLIPGILVYLRTNNSLLFCVVLLLPIINIYVFGVRLRYLLVILVHVCVVSYASPVCYHGYCYTWYISITSTYSCGTAVIPNYQAQQRLAWDTRYHVWVAALLLLGTIIQNGGWMLDASIERPQCLLGCCEHLMYCLDSRRLIAEEVVVEWSPSAAKMPKERVQTQPNEERKIYRPSLSHFYS